MGFFPMVIGGDPKVMAFPQGRRWNEMIHSGQGATAALEIIGSFSQGKMALGLLPTPGTPAYRSASIALFCCGFATFALLYTVQPLLPLFSTEFRIDAATASVKTLTSGHPTEFARGPANLRP